MESVCCLCFTVGIVGGVFDVVNTLFVTDLMDRAARAVARDNSLQVSAASDQDQLLARAWNAIWEEVGDRLDPDLVTIDIKVYDNPSKMLAGEESTGANRLLGGDAGDMVVVRLGFRPPTLIARLRTTLEMADSDDVVFQALAVVRNERTPELVVVNDLPRPADGPVPVAEGANPLVMSVEPVTET